MSARILSFFRHALGLQGDWSPQEIAEFYRVEAATLQAGVRIVSDRGVSDEGDPWFVFCRSQDETVFLHFARIDGLYCIDGEGIEGVLRGPDFRALLTELTQRHPTFLPIPPQGPNAKVLLHPGALLTAIVVTACLLAAPTDALANAQALDQAPHAPEPDPTAYTPMSGTDISYIEPEQDVREATQDLTERRAFIAGAAYLAASFAITLAQPEDHYEPSVDAPKSLESLGTESVEQVKGRARVEETAVQDLRFQTARADHQDGAVDLLDPTHTPSWLRSSPELLFAGSNLGHQGLNATQPSGPTSIGFVGQSELGHTANVPHDVQLFTTNSVAFSIFLERTTVPVTGLASGGTAIKSGPNVIIGDARPSDNPILTISDTVHASSTTTQQTTSSISAISTNELVSSTKTLSVSIATLNNYTTESTQKIQTIVSNNIVSSTGNAISIGSEESLRDTSTAQSKTINIGSATSNTILNNSEGLLYNTSSTQLKINSLNTDIPTNAQHYLANFNESLSISSQSTILKVSGLVLTSPSDSSTLGSIHTTPIAVAPDGNTSNFTSIHNASSAVVLDAKAVNTAPSLTAIDPTLYTTAAAGNGASIQSLGVSSVRDGSISSFTTGETSTASIVTLAQIPNSSISPNSSSVSSITAIAPIGSVTSTASPAKIDPNIRSIDASQTKVIDYFIAHTANLGATFVDNTLLLFDTVPVIGSSAQVTTWDLGGGSRLEIVGLSNVIHG